MLLLHEVGHAILFLSIVLLVNLVSKKTVNKRLLILGLIVTLFMDIDHLFDYISYNGLTLNLSAITSGSYFEANQKVYVLFHSWELTAIFALGWIIANKCGRFKLGQTFKIAFLAFLAHLVWDVVYYGFNLLSYFEIYRISHGFDIGVF